MTFVRVAVLVGILGAVPLQSASANPLAPSRELDRSSPYMRVFGVSHPPYGFVQFCERTPNECRPGPQEDHRLSATSERLNELDTINRAVNREVDPATDFDVYGQTEYWTLPSVRGDCEDYALLKRRRLIARGWPASALLMTVVRDEKGEGHAVLTARTLQGDFILDNKTDEVRIWYRTSYEFVMRQSYLNPRIWMSLDPREGSSSVPLAGVRSWR